MFEISKGWAISPFTLPNNWITVLYLKHLTSSLILLKNVDILKYFERTWPTAYQFYTLHCGLDDAVRSCKIILSVIKFVYLRHTIKTVLSRINFRQKKLCNMLLNELTDCQMCLTYPKLNKRVLKNQQYINFGENYLQ